jgi:hypothetical protein
MRKCALAVLSGLVCLGLGMAPALAEDDGWGDEGGGDELDRAREGFFLTATANYAVDNFSLPDTQGLAGSPGRDFNRDTIDPSWGFSVRAGWRFNRFLAAEGQLEYENDFGFRGNEVTDPNQLFGGVRAVTFFANGRGYIPGSGLLEGWIQPYAVAGFGFMAVGSTDRTIQIVVDGMPTDIEFQNAGFQVGPALRGGFGFDIYGYGSDAAGVNIETAYAVGLGDVWETQYWVTNFGLFYRW